MKTIKVDMKNGKTETATVASWNLKEYPNGNSVAVAQLARGPVVKVAKLAGRSKWTLLKVYN